MQKQNVIADAVQDAGGHAVSIGDLDEIQLRGVDLSRSLTAEHRCLPVTPASATGVAKLPRSAMASTSFNALQELQQLICVLLWV